MNVNKWSDEKNQSYAVRKFLVQMIGDKKGFYTTWRLLSWNRYLIVLGLVTKRPKTSNEETKG